MTKPFKVYWAETFSTSRNMTQQPSSRDSKTLPPPPPGATAAELDQKVADLRRVAASILAQSNDLERISRSMRGAA